MDPWQPVLWVELRHSIWLCAQIGYISTSTCGREILDETQNILSKLTISPPHHISFMSVVGSLIFCDSCGNLLDRTTGDTIECENCNATYPAAKYKKLEIITRSAPGAFPSVLKQKRSVVQVTAPPEQENDGRATIQEKCPQCGNDTMTFFTLQLRSADEGSTVFYECPRCAHKHSTNN